MSDTQDDTATQTEVPEGGQPADVTTPRTEENIGDPGVPPEAPNDPGQTDAAGTAEAEPEVPEQEPGGDGSDDDEL